MTLAHQAQEPRPGATSHLQKRTEEHRGLQKKSSVFFCRYSCILVVWPHPTHKTRHHNMGETLGRGATSPGRGVVMGTRSLQPDSLQARSDSSRQATSGARQCSEERTAHAGRAAARLTATPPGYFSYTDVPPSNQWSEP